jgi:hypothetical protein
MIPHRPSRRPLPSIGMLATLLLAVLAPLAHATDIGITFASLPSTQGWAFVSGGSPVATEAQTFSVSGGILTFDTMAFGITGSGTSAFYSMPGVVSASDPIVITMRGRLTAHEGDFTNTFVGGGFSFGFAQGTTLWQMGITPTQIRNVNGTILSTAYDNTQFHDYRIEWSPPSTVRYYVDNVLISTNSAGIASATNRLTLGDVTGAANARAEITEYRFLQGLATPAASESWGQVKTRGR